MGHSLAHKQQTHDRIVQLAAQRFRELGIGGVSIADLMKDAGLTHGGFYKHFESRDDLVAEALAVALESSGATRRQYGADTFESLVVAYLSKKHRDTLESACALSALVNDISRARGDARALYTEQLRRGLAGIAGLLDSPADSAHSEAIVAFSAMVGALGLARAVDDAALSKALLDTVRDYLLKHFAHASESQNDRSKAKTKRPLRQTRSKG